MAVMDEVVSHKTPSDFSEFCTPLLPASAIDSLSCGAVSKIPPIDVIELATELRLLP